MRGSVVQAVGAGLVQMVDSDVGIGGDGIGGLAEFEVESAEVVEVVVGVGVAKEVMEGVAGVVFEV